MAQGPHMMNTDGNISVGGPAIMILSTKSGALAYTEDKNNNVQGFTGFGGFGKRPGTQ
jgi:hypothetical protein